MTYSLSWFKKRTAALNKALGTRFSPSKLYRAQENSEIRALLEQFTDPRSAAWRSTERTLQARVFDLRWSNFISSNASAHDLYRAFENGGYISPDGKSVAVIMGFDANGAPIYERTNFYTGATKVVGDLPKSYRAITAKDVEQGLRDLGKIVRRHQRSNPLYNYAGSYLGR